MKSLFLLFILAFFPFLSFGRCPNIEGHFTPDGKKNQDSYIIVKKIDCATFEIIPGLGERLFLIKLGANEKCDDSVLLNVCYSGNILDANEVIFKLKETLKFDSCVREETLKINEEKRTVERDIKVNCAKKGITSYPKVKFQKFDQGEKGKK